VLVVVAPEKGSMSYHQAQSQLKLSFNRKEIDDNNHDESREMTYWVRCFDQVSRVVHVRKRWEHGVLLALVNVCGDDDVLNIAEEEMGCQWSRLLGVDLVLRVCAIEWYVGVWLEKGKDDAGEGTQCDLGP
jgi:hypothetical protein